MIGRKLLGEETTTPTDSVTKIEPLSDQDSILTKKSAKSAKTVKTFEYKAYETYMIREEAPVNTSNIQFTGNEELNQIYSHILQNR